MHASMHVRKLATALVALEYSLADFRTSNALFYDNPELDEIDDLVAVLSEANRVLVAALANLEEEGPRRRVQLNS